MYLRSLTMVLLVTWGYARAQNTPVQVDHVTGASNVVVPLFTIRNGGVSVPVSLVYDGSGIKPKDPEGTAGMGWNVQAGGTITREVRGLPDDCKKDLAGNDRLGWLYNTNGTKISNFSIANDNSSSTCSDETADLNYINSNFSDLSDTEPDIFFVSAPGLSCKLVFDNNHTIRTIPYMDTKVSYTTATDGSIIAFTLVNDQGTEYIFDYPDLVTRSTTSTNAAAISFFKRNFNFYQNKISYNNTWKLNSIKDASGNLINFDYITSVDLGGFVNVQSKDSVNVITGNGSSYSKARQYIETETYRSYYLTMIYYTSAFGVHSWQFKYRTNEVPHKPIVSLIRCPDKDIGLYYEVASNVTPSSYRSFLTKIAIAGYPSPTLYEFDYYGRNDYIIPLADSSSREVDSWGYYNASGVSSLVPLIYLNPSDPSAERYRSISPGSSSSYSIQLSGNNRASSEAAAITGSLSKIIYPDGGYIPLLFMN